jgi:hypothetical protein
MREVADPESLGEDKFFALWEEFKGRSPASAGWTMMELIRRFPEFGEWLRKTR